MATATLGRALLGLALAALGSGCAGLGGGDWKPPLDPALTRCEPDAADRLRFLESQLASHARYAGRWWWAWNGVYTAGIAVGGTRAELEDDRGERAGHAVDAVKSSIGLGRNLYAPPLARKGVEAIQAISTDRPEGCAERVAAAEGLLRDAAREAHAERRGWLSHLGNLGLNLLGAVIVAEGFDEGGGWGSGALGFLVGEIRIWTYPWQAERTLAEYEERFPPTASAPPRWRTVRHGERVTLVLD